MSANDIVVFEEQADGTFKAYHRDMDCYCEVEYKVKCHEEIPIFQAATMRECVRKYNAIANEIDGKFQMVEYGYVFELRAGNEANPS